MAELVTLTVPVTPPTLTTWRVKALHLNWDDARIDIHLRGTNGEEMRHSYGSTTATNLMNFMNTKDFRSTSLHKECMKRLINDGVFAGTISGTPDT